MVNRKRPRMQLSLAPSTIAMMDTMRVFEKSRSRIVDKAVAYYNKKMVK